MTLTPDSTVYAAALWWDDCDPFARIVGIERRTVAKEAQQQYDLEMQDAVAGGEVENLTETLHVSEPSTYRAGDVLSQDEREELSECREGYLWLGQA